MAGTLVCLVIIFTFLLVGFMFYAFLVKASKGRTKIKWKLALYNILHIEFESEHNDNT